MVEIWILMFRHLLASIVLLLKKLSDGFTRSYTTAKMLLSEKCALIQIFLLAVVTERAQTLFILSMFRNVQTDC